MRRLLFLFMLFTIFYIDKVEVMLDNNQTSFYIRLFTFDSDECFRRFKGDFFDEESGACYINPLIFEQMKI